MNTCIASPLMINFAIATKCSPNPEKQIGPMVWNSFSGLRAREWMDNNGLTDGFDGPPTDKLTAWLDEICNTPLPDAPVADQGEFVTDLMAVFRAGFVRRWHTNPDLADTCDRIDGHGARVARIILALHPDPSVDLLRSALIHDDGESVVGDVKAPTKDAFPIIADALAEMESLARVELWGERGRDLFDDGGWLKFADRLDAYMWAAHRAPHVLNGDSWPEAWEWLRAEGERLGADSGLDAVVALRRTYNAAS